VRPAREWGVAGGDRAIDERHESDGGATLGLMAVGMAYMFVGMQLLL
jgi:hypothetical protein